MHKYPYNPYLGAFEPPIDAVNSAEKSILYDFGDIDDYIFFEDEKAFSER